jgi:hypothetical protein
MGLGCRTTSTSGRTRSLRPLPPPISTGPPGRSRGGDHFPPRPPSGGARPGKDWQVPTTSPWGRSRPTFDRRRSGPTRATHTPHAYGAEVEEQVRRIHGARDAERRGAGRAPQGQRKNSTVEPPRVSPPCRHARSDRGPPPQPSGGEPAVDAAAHLHPARAKRRQGGRVAAARRVAHEAGASGEAEHGADAGGRAGTRYLRAARHGSASPFCPPSLAGIIDNCL